MGNPTFLPRERLWFALKTLARRNRGRTWVAAPYVGRGAARLLPLKSADVLLCALTRANSKNGSVCPSELRYLRNKRHVRVFVRDDLHAKIYLFGRTAVVCSANLSESSKSDLDEAGILTTDPEAIRDIRRWFEARLVEPLTPKWLAECEKVYRPPAATGARPDRPVPRDQPGLRRRVWLLKVSEMDLPSSEEGEREKGHRAAKGRARRGGHYEVEDIRWSSGAGFPTRVKVGDLCIQVFCPLQGKRIVLPHGRLLGKRRVATRRGSATYLYLEVPDDYRTVPWSLFLADCRKVGLRVGKGLSAREVRRPEAVERLLSLTSPERLLKRGR